MDEVEPIYDDYFVQPTTIEELRSAYSETDEQELLTIFYDLWQQHCLLGIFDGSKIHVITIPIDGILDSIKKEQYIEANAASERGVFLGEETLKQLKALKSLKEIRSTIEYILGNIDKPQELQFNKNEDKKSLTIKKEELKKIKLKELKISPLKIEEEFFKDMGIKFKYTSDYINEIVSKSEKSKLDARNLKKIVKNSLKYAYEEVLSTDDIKELKITKETIDNSKVYYIKR